MRVSDRAEKKVIRNAEEKDCIKAVHPVQSYYAS